MQISTYWPGRELGIDAAVALVRKDVRRFDRDLAAARHRVARIDGDIDQRGFEMVGVGLDLPQAGGADHRDVDRLAEGSLQKLRCRGQEFVGVERFRVERLAARERQQAAGQRGGPLRAAHGIVDGALKIWTGGLGDLGLALRVLQIADHDHHQVVEIVRDAAAELADGFHALRGGELLLRRRAAPAVPACAPSCRA